MDPAFAINPTAQNPNYGEAMRLLDVQPGKEFVSFDALNGNLLVTTLSSSWWETEIPIINEDETILGSYASLLARDVYGRELRLPARGIHPYLGENAEWNRHRFSILAEREPVVRFYFWLEKNGYPRTANVVKGTFFDFFVDDDFWGRLLWQCRP